MQITECCRAMIAIEPDGGTCAARKSMPDIETNVRPILSDIATPRVIDGPRYSISAKVGTPAAPAARRRHSLPFSNTLTRLTRHPMSPSSTRTFGLYRFSYPIRNAWLGEGIPGRQKVILENSVSSLIASLLLERPREKANCDEQTSKPEDESPCFFTSIASISCNARHFHEISMSMCLQY